MLVYIHVPFCRKRCAYCAFHSQALKTNSLPSSYLATLVKEIPFWQEQMQSLLPPKQQSLETIFIGGGTPSLLSPNEIGTLLDALDKAFGLHNTLEISMEANPDSLHSQAKIAALLSVGINRISLGIQSMQPQELTLLGRLHSQSEACKAYHALRAAGCSNVNIDLMWGLPQQSVDTWLQTLEAVCRLQPDHISAYELSLEANTPLAQRFHATDLPSEQTLERMYLEGAALLEEHGFRQYEISNYAQTGHECRHNLGYWQGKDYLGLGPGAVSTIGSCRWTDIPDFMLWQQCYEQPPTWPQRTQTTWPWPHKLAQLCHKEELSTQEKAFEYLMLSLRSVQGLSFARYQAISGQDFLAKTAVLLQDLEQRNLVLRDTHGLRLSRPGFLLSNAIINALAERIEED